MNKLVAIPLEEGEIVGYLEDIEDVEEQDGLVIATLLLPEEQELTYVVCWSNDIEERSIH